MSKINDYLEEYSESHQNPTNILIHKFCVPAIMFSILGFLKAIPVPEAWPLWLDWSFIDSKIFVSMLLFIIPQVLLLEYLKPRFFILCFFIFIIAWILQFIGHIIEGKKPAFFADLLFLLIGPIWVMKALGKKFNNAKDT